MGKFWKFFIAVILLPTAFFALWQLGRVVFDLVFVSKSVLFFIAGAVIYAAVHIKIYNFSRLYVLAHEGMHALAALFFGYKVHSMKVKEDSGQVKMSDINAAVVLAPYVVPLYFLIGALVCFILYKTGYDNAWWVSSFAAVLGFLWGFHILHTVKTLTETTQPDLKAAGGKTFSLVVIVVVNILFALIITAVIFPGHVSLFSALKDIFVSTFKFWKAVIDYAVDFTVRTFKL